MSTTPSPAASSAPQTPPTLEGMASPEMAAAEHILGLLSLGALKGALQDSVLTLRPRLREIAKFTSPPALSRPPAVAPGAPAEVVGRLPAGYRHGHNPVLLIDPQGNTVDWSNQKHLTALGHAIADAVISRIAALAPDAQAGAAEQKGKWSIVTDSAGDTFTSLPDGWLADELAASDAAPAGDTLPCDVKVQPATVIRKGSSMSTLMLALDECRKWVAEGQEIPAWLEHASSAGGLPGVDRMVVARLLALHGLGTTKGSDRLTPPNETWTQEEWERRVLECVPVAVERKCLAAADAIIGLLAAAGTGDAPRSQAAPAGTGAGAAVAEGWREALEWYADPRNWFGRNSSGPGWHVSGDGSIERLESRPGDMQRISANSDPTFFPDCGQRARKALATTPAPQSPAVGLGEVQRLRAALDRLIGEIVPPTGADRFKQYATKLAVEAWPENVDAVEIERRASDIEYQILQDFAFEARPYLDRALKAEAELATLRRDQDADRAEVSGIWRHVKTGGIYTVLGIGNIQSSVPLDDMAEVVVYRGTDGRLWSRNAGEFHDGRFTRHVIASSQSEGSK